MEYHQRFDWETFINKYFFYENTFKKKIFVLLTHKLIINFNEENNQKIMYEIKKIGRLIEI